MDLLNAYSDESAGEEDETPLPSYQEEEFVRSHVLIDREAEGKIANYAPEVARMPAAATNDQDSDDDDFGPQPAAVETSDVPERAGDEEPEPLLLTAQEAFDQYALAKKIPIASEVNLAGHTKAVASISIEPAGNRLATGSLDYCAKIYDFGGMDSRHRAFQSIEVEDGQPVICISHSPSGDRFVVATVSTQPRVYDRDGNEVIKFARGDMYLRDMAKTKGHTMEVTCAQWHPVEKTVIMTASLDGTIRLWDLLGEANFGMLINKHVLKAKASATQRVGVTACCYNPDGSRIFGGMADGSIVVFHNKKVFSRADLSLTPPSSSQCDQQTASALAVSPKNTCLVARYGNGKVLVWAIHGNNPVTAPQFQINDLHNMYPTANLAFSPDASLLVGCTSAKGKKSNELEGADKSRMLFFELSGFTPKPPASPAVLRSQLAVALTPAEGDDVAVSGICVKWHAATNHIFCTLSSGLVRVFFDATMSTKGALLSTRRAPKRIKDPSDFAIVGEIIAPLAHAMFREDSTATKGKKRVMELKDPTIAKIPEKPISSGPGSRVNTSFFFTQYVTGGKSHGGTHEDPREALLKYAEGAKAEPRFLGRAYQHTQPEVQLQTKTLEQEQDESKAKARRLN